MSTPPTPAGAPEDAAGAPPWWLLAGVSAAAMLAVLAGSDRVPAADGPHMLAQCLRLAQLLHEGAVGEVIAKVGTLAAPHPPVGYLPPLVLAALGGSVQTVVLLGDLVCIALLAHGLHLLCCGEHPRTAPLALFLGLGTGLCWWAADHYGFDLVGAAVVAQALGWLAASEGLARPGPRRLFGLWLALGFLTKYSVPLILCAPVILVCAPALLRRPRAVAEAVGLWALVAVPYYAVNHAAVMAYVGDTLVPPDLPGEYPEELSFSERFGQGQRLMLAALEDAFGAPLALALALGAAWRRRWLPLSAVLGGVLLLGTLNEQQGRYVLPMVFLVAVAGAPWPGRWARWHAAVLVGLGLLGMRASLGTYAQASAAEVPAQRWMQHDRALGELGGWPELATPYQPISAPLARWQVPRAVAALGERVPAGGLGALLLDGPPYQPNSAMYMMVAEEEGRGLDLLTIHARLTGSGELVVNDYVGPFPRELGRDPGAPAWAEVRWAWLVVKADGQGAGWTWLNHQPHVIADQWDLPDGYRGLLVELLEAP